MEKLYRKVIHSFTACCNFTACYNLHMEETAIIFKETKLLDITEYHPMKDFWSVDEFIRQRVNREAEAMHWEIDIYPIPEHLKKEEKKVSEDVGLLILLKNLIP